jgi:ABC-type phosphate transport system substrate-binding protein
MRLPRGRTRLILIAAMTAVTAAGAGTEPAGAHGVGPAAVPVALRSTVAAAPSTATLPEATRPASAPAAADATLAHAAPAVAVCVQPAGFGPGIPVVIAAATRLAHVRRTQTNLRAGRRRVSNPPLVLGAVALAGHLRPADDASAVRRGAPDYAPVDTS